MSGKIALVEVFRSPQGEGYNVGRPAIFVRFAGCNLSCVFAGNALCDTPYQAATQKLDLYELQDSITDLMWGTPKSLGIPEDVDERIMLILTGGEPTLAPSFDQVVDWGVGHGFYVAVETNGTTWRDGLEYVDWVSVSPKDEVRQGSPAPFHNHNPQDPTLNPMVIDLLSKKRENGRYRYPGEYRYVIGPDSPMPPWNPAFRHYLSPAVISDGSGSEWKTGFPGFVPGALRRCQDICDMDYRWRISIQTHKILGVR